MKTPAQCSWAGEVSAGGGRFDLEFLALAVPPDGPLTFAVQWAEEGIELTRVEVEGVGDPRSGRTSGPLWPELGGGGRGITRSSFRTSWGSRMRLA